MVVCNTPMLRMAPATCPITPAAIHPFSSGVCSFRSISCNQRYPQATILPNGQIITQTAVSCPPCIPPPPIRCNQTSISSQSNPSSSPDSSPDNSVIACNVITPSNGILTSNLVPCTSASIMPLTNGIVPMTNGLVPYSQGLTSIVYNTKLGCSQVTSSNSTVQCNQGVYTCSQPLPGTTVVPCTQRVLNGTSVLPGVCQIAPTAVLPPGTVEMCPIPPTSIIPGSEIFPVTPPNLCSATAAPSWKQSYGMEQVWQSEFSSLFSQYSPHAWMLVPVIQKPVGMWNSNVDSAKVRFCCEVCGHGWTSMKGRVAFWFVLNPTSGDGVVCLKLYGQQCDRCKTGNYEPAMWYPEEVLKVLVNIYNRVGQVYYGFQQAPYHKVRRAGKPRTPHNSDLCQACKDGVCAERR